MIIQIGEFYNVVPDSTLAAIVAGVVVFVIILIICCCCCCCRKIRKKKKKAQKIHVEDPPEEKGNKKGGPTQQRQHKNNPQQAAEHSVGPIYSPTLPSQSPYINHNSENRASSTMNGSSVPPQSTAPSFCSRQTMFSYDELAIATNSFSKGNILGKGGFGFVHKGVLPTGKEIAVKSLKSDSCQGEREFQAEVEIISRVHHRHLVSLVGYCMTGSQRLLVYEFVPNNTLEFHLHGKRRPPMDWPSRMKIALGAAKGLAYLHEDCYPRIIHRDIKAANILIDNNFEAKVADFGLAKVNSQAETYLSTRVMGTLGYLAPEYASSGKLTEKSDVYSFGVMLLELITGRRPVDRTQDVDILVHWARPLLTTAVEDENYSHLVDPRIQDCYKSTEISRMVYCAATCVRKSAKHRPQMSQVVRALEGNMSLTDLSVGVTPGRSMLNRYDSESEYSGSQYSRTSKGYTSSASEKSGSQLIKGDSRGFDSTAIGNGMSSREQYINSELGRTTSEHDLYPSSSSSKGETSRVLDPNEVVRDTRWPPQQF